MGCKHPTSNGRRLKAESIALGIRGGNCPNGLLGLFAGAKPDLMKGGLNALNFGGDSVTFRACLQLNHGAKILDVHRRLT
jgi:hypothetical protein